MKHKRKNLYLFGNMSQAEGEGAMRLIEWGKSLYTPNGYVLPFDDSNLAAAFNWIASIARHYGLPPTDTDLMWRYLRADILTRA